MKQLSIKNYDVKLEEGYIKSLHKIANSIKEQSKRYNLLSTLYNPVLKSESKMFTLYSPNAKITLIVDARINSIDLKKASEHFNLPEFMQDQLNNVVEEFEPYIVTKNIQFKVGEKFCNNFEELHKFLESEMPMEEQLFVVHSLIIGIKSMMEELNAFCSQSYELFENLTNLKEEQHNHIVKIKNLNSLLK